MLNNHPCLLTLLLLLINGEILERVLTNSHMLRKETESPNSLTTQRGPCSCRRQDWAGETRGSGLRSGAFSYSPASCQRGSAWHTLLPTGVSPPAGFPARPPQTFIGSTAWIWPLLCTGLSHNAHTSSRANTSHCQSDQSDGQKVILSFREPSTVISPFPADDSLDGSEP